MPGRDVERYLAASDVVPFDSDARRGDAHGVVWGTVARQQGIMYPGRHGRVHIPRLGGGEMRWPVTPADETKRGARLEGQLHRCEGRWPAGLPAEVIPNGLRRFQAKVVVQLLAPPRPFVHECSELRRMKSPRWARRCFSSVSTRVGDAAPNAASRSSNQTGERLRR